MDFSVTLNRVNSLEYLFEDDEFIPFDANVGKFHFTLRPNRCEATGSNMSQCAIAHYFTFGWGRIFHSFLPTEPNPRTDSNRHTVGATNGRPYNYKIIYKNMDATAFWTDLNHRNIFPTIWRFFVVRIISNRQMISSF